jgi:hypothetical protein
MELEKRLKNARTKTGICRRRRFRCTICDYKKVIFSGGSGDEKLWPSIGIDEVNKIFQQEEINRLGRPNKIH